MKIRTSYFYQIRNFPVNYIPVSTCRWDPKWFHDFTGDYNHLFKDKRGIYNGIRLLPVIVQDKVNCRCQICPHDEWDTCTFLKEYRQELDNIDFDAMWEEMEKFAAAHKLREGYSEEPVIVLIVYETPQNPCSERRALQDYFTMHGKECKELDYPIV